MRAGIDSMARTLLAATALASSLLFIVPGAQAFDWNGPYAGGVVGVVKSTGTMDWSYLGEFEVIDGVYKFDGLGALAGVTAGFNYTLNDTFVVGIEGDASVAWLKSSGTFDEIPTFGEFEEELQSLLTLRSRLGILSDDKNTLFFVTAGLAGGNVKASAHIEAFGGLGPLSAAQMSGFVVGVVGGVGVEHAIKEDLTVKAEVLVYSLGSLDGSGFSGKGPSAATYNPSGVIFRTGINFHF